MLLQAVVRRYLLILLSLYFDDATEQDWAVLAHESQAAVAAFFEMCAYPFAPAKRQSPSVIGDFLGLVHDFSKVRQTGRIHVWVRQRLVDKILDLVDTAEASNSLRPGQASKLFGCVTFLDQGAFGRVARSGLSAIKERQYSAGAVTLSSEIRRAFETIRAIIMLRLERLVPVLPQHRRVLAASDAAQDGYRVGSGAFLLVTHDHRRFGAVVPITEGVFSLWDQQETNLPSSNC